MSTLPQRASKANTWLPAGSEQFTPCQSGVIGQAPDRTAQFAALLVLFLPEANWKTSAVGVQQKSVSQVNWDAV